MNFDFHVTRKSERDEMMKREFEEILINPNQMTHLVKTSDDMGKSIAWIEDTNGYIELDFKPIYDTLAYFDVLNRAYSYEHTPYYRVWHTMKGDEYCRVRIANLFALLREIRNNGFHKTDQMVSVSDTGERFDGQTRAVVAQYLKIPQIPVNYYRTNWRDMNDAYLQRRIFANKLSFPLNYYFVSVGGFQNISDPQEIYKENTAKWDKVLSDIVQPKGKKILDIGCNEGLHSIKAALEGATKVVGVDHEFVHGANFYRVLFEYVNKKDLPITFIPQSIVSYEPDDDFDVCLCLNVIYHIPQDKQLEVMRKLRRHCKMIVMQGNLRKIAEHERFFGISVNDMTRLLSLSGFKVEKVIENGDKPIVVGI